ncbi:MAG: hemin uptake protein HemP [Mariniblastus sp.]
MNTENSQPKNQNAEPAKSADEVDSMPAADQPVLPKIISFESLARCGEEIWIENNGQIYRLRRTKQGKLILTK